MEATASGIREAGRGFVAVAWVVSNGDAAVLNLMVIESDAEPRTTRDGPIGAAAG
jgi:hypothetical protein